MIEQGTHEWFEARYGNATASRIVDIMAKTKSGYSASRANYMAQLVCERMTGSSGNDFTSAAMQHGIDTEPLARSEYEAVTGVLVEQASYYPHPTIDRSGASPDGLIGEDGLLEIKCPNSATHIKTLLGSKLDRKYFLQMQWQMACTERQWCDFVSYDPRMGEGLQYYCERVERDDKLIEEISVEVQTFLIELDDMVAQLNKLRAGE